MNLRDKRARAWAIAAVLLTVATVLIVFLSRRGPRTTGAMASQAYLWQRAWTPAVVEAAEVAFGKTDASGGFDRIVILAAELTPSNGSGGTVIVQPDYAACRRGGSSVGLAIRINAYSGEFEADGAVTRHLVQVVSAVLASARSGGVKPVELQVDFDCPTARLAGYCLWVQAVSKAAAPVPVVITALPSWMGSRDFGKLVEAADGFVLQVHSVDPRLLTAEGGVLCDPLAALAAVERAGEFGRPFRVALPTYSYLAGFDKAGKLVGLAAEAGRSSWSDGVRLVRVSSDPSAMAALVRGWTADRPASMTGVIWYRLPVTGDKLNWHRQTLAAVAAGRCPRAIVTATAARAEPNLSEIIICNEGDADSPLPPELSVSWSGAELVACDGLAGMQIVSQCKTNVRFAPRDEAVGLIRPGQTIKAAWVRLDKDTEIRVDVISDAK